MIGYCIAEFTLNKVLINSYGVQNGRRSSCILNIVTWESWQKIKNISLADPGIESGDDKLIIIETWKN